MINKIKVCLTKSGRENVYPKIFKENEVFTESYKIIKICNTEKEANNLCNYIKTNFFKFLMSLLKNTQDRNKRVYQFIPQQDFTNNDFFDCLPDELDKKLYKKYNFTDDEIAFVEKMINGGKKENVEEILDETNNDNEDENDE
ncbi:MAG: hypothetical protein LBT02_01890 [Rickettsiales bacterium]|nr:hypothetical protein [Rickettsiales bacterium]